MLIGIIGNIASELSNNIYGLQILQQNLDAIKVEHDNADDVSHSVTLLIEHDSIDTKDTEPFTTSESSTNVIKAEVGYIVYLTPITPWNCSCEECGPVT
jgi:hypothetical protein